MLIGGELGYRLLRRISPGGEREHCTGTVYEGRGKVGALFGKQIYRELQERVVVDFGCGEGDEVVEIAQHGARRVIGVDIRPHILETARRRAEQANVSSRCVYVTAGPLGEADVVVSIDAFEHFADPATALRSMAELLNPNGCVLASFGPPWYHPYGGHLFSVFPWAHLVFTEKALIRWRADFKTDGATRFSEVEGGLNQMTLSRFRKLVAASPFCFAWCEAVPIRVARWFHNRLTEEILTSIVRCKLVRR